MDKEEMRAILEKHKKWILGESGGERADLRYANLRYLNLIDADLRYADLRYTNLIDANLAEADLRNVNLTGVDLTGAILTGALTGQIEGKSVISVQVDTSRPNNIISYWVDLGIWTTGCFQGTLEELKENIEETHKENDFLRERYYRVIDFILQEADEDNGRIEARQ